ncbi:MAG TPA: CBS domain-containing protein [Gemmatimonadota bacterium]|nr:CBS domain-containing protein [Gemmatimonadota bacterium]
MIVEDLITRSPVTVGRTDSVAEAALHMKEGDVGSVVVVDEDGDIVGIVTDRDIATRLVAEDLPARTTPVNEIMTIMPLCVGRGLDIEQALKKMEVHGVRRIPVLDEGNELVGVVSLDDILIHLGKTFGVAAALVRAEVAGLA